MNKDLDTALMLIMGWIAFAMLVAAVNLVVVVGKLIFWGLTFYKTLVIYIHDEIQDVCLC